MSISSCRSLVVLLLSVPLTAFAFPADTPTTPPPSSITPQTTPPQTYDQIVRLSLVEGDVRISRGKEGEHATGDAWGQAAVNIPIETGFNLVTGKGRAEIELEDASTIYLGEDSVLVFNQLTATGGIPRTDMTLVSGTATINMHLVFPGELFALRTPTDAIFLKYPDASFLRVNSYLDAMAITPQRDVTIHKDFSSQTTTKGQTVTYSKGHRIQPEPSSTPNAFADWDRWTAERVAERDVAISAEMKDSGLTQPIPGLAEMKDQGTFFACAPYGTCWQPTNGWGEYEAAPARLEVHQTSDPQQQQSTSSTSHTVSVQTLQAAGPSSAGPSGPSPILRTEYDEFPCSPDRVRRLIARDPLTGRETVLRTDYDLRGAPYDWAVCHTGTWIHHEHHYVWVAGTKRHHRCPVRWVKVGRTTAYVPLHPHDVAGKPPLNLKHGVFETTGKKGESVQRVALNSDTQVKLLSTAPKEFQKPYFPPLERVETPRIEARLVVPGKEGTAKPAGTAISFDDKSQSFTVARQITESGKTTTVTEHFGGQSDSFAARSNGGSRNGSSGSFGHSSSSVASSHSGGGSSGGGFHGGGGGGGFSGGGSHGGGGGGSSSGGGSSGGGGSHK